MVSEHSTVRQRRATMEESRLTLRREPETGVEIVAVRRPAAIVAGRLVGSEVVRRLRGYLVWTDRVRLARKLAKNYGLKLRLMDEEAEILIPLGLEALLRAFGAKFKRQLSPEARAKATARLATNLRRGSGVRLDPPRKALQDHGMSPMGPGTDSSPGMAEVPPTEGSDWKSTEDAPA